MGMLTFEQALAAYDISATNLRHAARSGDIAHIDTERGTLYRSDDVAAVVERLRGQKAAREARRGYTRTGANHGGR